MGIWHIIIIAVMCIASEVTDARKISYSGGGTLMVKSDSSAKSVYYHYSPSYKFSLGIEAQKDIFRETKGSYLRFNYLLNRKNTNTSQRNLYFLSGVSTDNPNDLFYGVEGDWETRELFSGFGYTKTEAAGRNISHSYVQIGIAPYVGDYGDLHTWLLLKSKKNSLTKEWQTYPMLKFFKGNVLVEIGYGNQGDWDLHGMSRF
jgi:hypothetical protein